jgi:hypothetical protein
MPHPRTHGESRRVRGVRQYTAEFVAWQKMIERCSPWHERLADYLDRGVAVYEEWLGDSGFQAFLGHVGRRPSSKHSIDRIDNGKGYEPGNVRWATRSEQGRNKRNNRMITVGDETMCLVEWSEVTGIPRTTLQYRLDAGWSPERAVGR